MRILRYIVVLGIAVLCVVDSAFAEGAPSVMSDWKAIAAGLTIALAAFGGAMGQSRAASTALESIGRNPRSASELLVPMIIGLALIESLVIYAFVISYMMF